MFLKLGIYVNLHFDNDSCIFVLNIFITIRRHLFKINQCENILTSPRAFVFVYSLTLVILILT